MLFPLTGSFVEDDGSINHHRLMKAIHDRPRSASPRPYQHLLDTFRHEIEESSASTLLISSEFPTWFFLDRGPIRDFKQLLSTDENLVVMYVRNVVDLAERAYVNVTLASGNTLSPSDWLRSNFDRLNLPAAWLRWAQVFGPGSIHVEHYPSSGDVVSSFSRVTGLNLKQLKPGNDRLNRGVPILLVPFLREFNSTGISSPQYSLTVREAANRVGPPFSSFRLFSTDDLEPLLALQSAKHDLGQRPFPNMELTGELPGGYFDRILLASVSPEEIVSFTNDVLAEVRNQEVEEGVMRGTQSILNAVGLDTLAAGALAAERDTWVVERAALDEERDGLLNDRALWVAHAEAMERERDGLIAQRDSWVAHPQMLAAERDSLIADRSCSVASDERPGVPLAIVDE